MCRVSGCSVYTFSQVVTEAKWLNVKKHQHKVPIIRAMVESQMETGSYDPWFGNLFGEVRFSVSELIP